MPGPEKRDNGVSYTIYTTFSFSDINVNLLLQFLVKLYRDLDADDRIELLKLLHLPHFSTSWQYEIEFGKLLRLGLHTSDYHNLWLCSLLSLGCLRRKSNYGKWILRDISDLGPIDLFWARWPWPGICGKYFLSFPQKNLWPEKTEIAI